MRIQNSLRLSRITRMAMIVIVILLGIFGLRTQSSTRAGTSSVITGEEQPADCKCADLPALINRRREVTAAINAIDKGLSQLEADEKAANKIIPYTDSDYSKYFSDPIEQAVSATHDRNSQQMAEPGNFTIDCVPSVVAQDISSCLARGVGINEASRKRFCESKIRTQTALGILSPSDWRPRYPVENMADAARQGYLAEQSYLKGQIERLQATCKFGKWSGEVTVSYIKETKFNQGSKTQPGPHQNWRTEETTINESEQVVITLVDGIAVAEGTADYSKQEESQVGPEIWCHASTRPDKAWVPFSHTEISLYQVSGSTFRGANVSVSFNQDGTYTISAGLPSGAGSGTSSKDVSETGECATGYPRTSNSTTMTVGGFHAKGKGKGKSTDLTLNGNDNPKPDVQPANSMITITMSWHLKRTSP